MKYTTASLLTLSAVTASVVDPALMRTMKHESSMNIFVRVKGGVDAAVSVNAQKRYKSRTSQIESLTQQLQENAALGQSSIMKVLEQESNDNAYGEATSMWISNTVYITDASPALIEALSKLPAVGDIHQEHIIQLKPIKATSTAAFNSTSQMDWGIPKVGAPEAWETYTKGAGIIVGSIDTGVRGTHESLKDNYVGAAENGWFDPYGNTKSPTDDNGHGTHTMGTIVGANGVGVAPEAKWLSCKGCSTYGCSEKALLDCGQFILCPTDTDGNNPDCSKAPHVSSNSWGGGQGSTWFDDVIKAWKAAGITPIFASGNEGPACSTASSPGDSPLVIGVGATGSDDTLAYFSSVGPTVHGLMKPDVSAPGFNVRSAWHTSDGEYKTISGTSMACPHVAGVVALMKAAHQNKLSYEQVYGALTASATTSTLAGNGRNCGEAMESTFPNNAFGYGQVHAANAIAALEGEQEVEPPVEKPQPESCRLVNFTCQPKTQCLWRWSFFGCKHH